MRLNRLLPALLALALTASSVLFQTAGAAAANEPGDVRQGEVVVELKPGASIEAVNQRNRTTTILQIYGTNFYRLAIPKIKKHKKWRNRLAADPDVLSAALNPTVSSPGLFGRSTTSFPDGFAAPGLSFAEFESQERLFDLLKLEDVELRSRGAGVVVAIIDTGIDRSHPALGSHIWTNPLEQADGLDNDGNGLVDDIHGWNFVDGNGDTTEDPDDPQTTVAGHGTFIAGLVAMVAPDCRIMPVRAFPAEGVSDGFTVAAAVKYAADHGADVINLSLGSSETSELLLSAILDARARGITLVAAVGNDNSENVPQFPSSLEEVMAVAAIETSGHKAPFSNFGTHVDVSAPGARLVSTFPGREGQYARWSGTSFSAPLAAAEAALVLAADRQQPDVKRIIEATAVNIDELNEGFEGKLGKGRINPLAALQSLNATSNVRTPLDIHSSIELTRGSVDSVARGKTSITVKGARQEFTVEAQMLSVRTTYTLVVDGVALSSDVSANLGSLRFAFVTEPERAPLPVAIEPVTKIRRVELRDSLDRVVLQGIFSADKANPDAGFLEREARLVSADTVLHAAGSASARIEALPNGTRRESLTVVGEGLTSETSYFLLIDGISTGVSMSRSGFLRVVLTSDASSGQILPPSLRPVTNIRQIQLRDGFGRTVLQGSFAATALQIKPPGAVSGIGGIALKP